MNESPTKPRGRPRKIVEKKIIQDEPYKIALVMGKETYSGEGATPLAALQALHPPQKIFLKGILRISHGTTSKELLMMPVQLKRIFFPSFQHLNVKWLVSGLK